MGYDHPLSLLCRCWYHTILPQQANFLLNVSRSILVLVAAFLFSPYSSMPSELLGNRTVFEVVRHRVSRKERTGLLRINYLRVTMLQHAFPLPTLLQDVFKISTRKQSKVYLDPYTESVLVHVFTASSPSKKIIYNQFPLLCGTTPAIRSDPPNHHHSPSVTCPPTPPNTYPTPKQHTSKTHTEQHYPSPQ